jgi:hypothetical protein
MVNSNVFGKIANKLLTHLNRCVGACTIVNSQLYNVMSNLKVSTYSLELIGQSLCSLREQIGAASMNISPSLGWEFMAHVDKYLFIESLTRLGLVGVWDSHSHGKIVWYRVLNPMPLYTPLLVIMDGQPARKIAQYDYRAIVLDLNNALLQEEGFE